MVRAPIEPIIVFLGAARQVTADRSGPRHPRSAGQKLAGDSCSLALAAEEAIGRGSCGFSRLDVPRAGKIPAARPRLITARPRRRCLRHLPWRHANMDDAFLILTL